jgi:disulfide bond formation protein DsbB
MIPRWLPTAWPLLAALAALALLGVAHAFETFGHLAPCELCLKQRTGYWIAAAVGIVGYAAARGLKRPTLLSITSLLLGLVFLGEAGLAAYHAGVEWHWWPGPTSCTGSGAVSAGAMSALLSGAKVARPSCDVAAWRMAGLSMAGWNVLAALILCIISFKAMGSRRRGLEPV